MSAETDLAGAYSPGLDLGCFQGSLDSEDWGLECFQEDSEYLEDFLGSEG